MKGHAQRDRMKGIPVNGLEVKRLYGMIYWYGWGSWEFDIRVVRKLLGLPQEHPDDYYFRETPCDKQGSFARIIGQIQDALNAQQKRLFDVIKEHDVIIMKQGQDVIEGIF